MAISAEAAGAQAALARRRAEAILAEGRFHVAAIPRPLHGVLHAIGSALESPLQALEELVGDLGASTPGGSTTVWAVLAAVVLALGGLLASRGARRALAGPQSGYPEGRARRPVTPGELEREALASERDGDHAEAVRLRFRAGLMRLSERELVADAPAKVNSEVSRTLGSRRFDALARHFDQIAYGGRPAAAEDVELSRREWSELLRADRDR